MFYSALPLYINILSENALEGKSFTPTSATSCLELRSLVSTHCRHYRIHSTAYLNPEVQPLLVEVLLYYFSAPPHSGFLGIVDSPSAARLCNIMTLHFHQLRILMRAAHHIIEYRFSYCLVKKEANFSTDDAFVCCLAVLHLCCAASNVTHLFCACRSSNNSSVASSRKKQSLSKRRKKSKRRERRKERRSKEEKKRGRGSDFWKKRKRQRETRKLPKKGRQ